jgi:hypothetical protein
MLTNEQTTDRSIVCVCLCVVVMCMMPWISAFGADMPGPGSYAYEMRSTSPRFSMAGRPQSALGVASKDGPGPGSYAPRVDILGRRAPAHSMGSRVPLSTGESGCMHV